MANDVVYYHICAALVGDDFKSIQLAGQPGTALLPTCHRYPHFLDTLRM